MKFETSSNLAIWHRTEQVFGRLIQAEQFETPPKLIVCTNNCLSAFACFKRNLVLITESFCELYAKDGSLAAVLGHELGHIKCKHDGDRNLERELEVDHYGIILARQAGFSDQEIRECEKFLWGLRLERFKENFH